MRDVKFETTYIKEQYFKNNSHFVKMLDHFDIDKQIRRCYLFLKVQYENNNLLVPLKTHVTPIKKYGIIGYSVPAADKPEAGLDYRYILIINDENYLEKPQFCRIPTSQQNILNKEYDKIKNEVVAYVNGYVTAAVKGRVQREPKFRESSLQNFHAELMITEKQIEREESKGKIHS